jgi:hypothetical protein
MSFLAIDGVIISYVREPRLIETLVACQFTTTPYTETCLVRSLSNQKTCDCKHDQIFFPHQGVFDEFGS